MEIVLTIATVLGGLGALWFFWDKIVLVIGICQRNEGGAEPAAGPVEKWVDFRYPHDSGLQATLEAKGYKVAWCSDRNLARRVDLEGWEVVKEACADGVLAKLRLKDRPANQTLLMKRRE